MGNPTKDEIVNILNDTSNDSKCILSGCDKNSAVCYLCKFHKNEKCTFNIWKWQGIGGK